MTKRLCWLVPDDRGGGVVSVATSCCRQARQSGHDVVLLMALKPTGHIGEHATFKIAALNASAPWDDVPARLVDWLEKNPQDAIFINGCEQADVAIPYLPSSTRAIYVVHDTARRYWNVAVDEEQNLDAIVAVSNTVSDKFRRLLRNPRKLNIIHNGTLFPDLAASSNGESARADILFLGGDQPAKGAYDVMHLWPRLLDAGFLGHLHVFGNVGAAWADAVQKLGRSDRITLHGRVRRSEIFAHAARAAALLMLSRVEPFGMATVECMGMGCLPVAWNIRTGTDEILQGRYGFSAQLGDYHALAAKVLEACRVSAAGRAAAIAHAREQFSEAAMWRGYSALIDRVSMQDETIRVGSGQRPPVYRAPFRLFQLLPKAIREIVRRAIGRSARLGYWLRDFRGI